MNRAFLSYTHDRHATDHLSKIFGQSEGPKFYNSVAVSLARASTRLAIRQEQRWLSAVNFALYETALRPRWTSSVGAVNVGVEDTKDVLKMSLQNSGNWGNRFLRFSYSGGKTMTDKHIYEFGDYQLDAQQKILLCDGERISLHPKTFATLLALIESGGAVITKDELLEKVWPDTFVEESSLTKNIALLRKALRNGHDHSDYIETIPTIGYRFVAEFRQVSAESIAQQPDWVNHPDRHTTTEKRDLSFSAKDENHEPTYRQVPSPPRRHFGKISLLVATGVALITVIPLVLVQWREISKPANFFTQLQIHRLTSSNDAFESAISPDGKFVSYILGNTGPQSLWLRNLATKQERQLLAPALNRYRGLAFSRDGKFIYYSQRRQHDSMFVLYKIPLTGGTPLKLLAGVDSAVSFSPDGKQLTFVREDQTTRESLLMISNADGTAERRLAVSTAPVNYSVDGPSWSPDGKLVAIAKMIPSPDFHFRLMTVRVADGVEEPIGETKWAWMMRVAWLAEGEALAVVGRLKSRGTNTQLWRVSFPLGALQRITNDLNEYRNLSLTADKLVTVLSEVRSDVWVLQPEKEEIAKRITNAPTNQNGLGLTWTQEGKIVYTSNAGGHQNLWIMNADGSQPQQLTPDFDDYDYFPVISSVGKYVVFPSSRSGASHLWRIDTDGSNLKEMTRGDNDLKPQYSPDGKWIVYSSGSSEKKGPRVIVKMDATNNASEPIPLTDNFADYPVISPNNKWIACLYQETTSSSRKIALLPFTGKDPVRLLEIPYLNWPIIRWFPNSSTLCYLDPRDNASNIWLFPLTGETPTKLTRFTDETIFEYAWSHDGRSLACARGVAARDVVLLDGVR